MDFDGTLGLSVAFRRRRLESGGVGLTGLIALSTAREYAGARVKKQERGHVVFLKSS